jgi:hypothetical protein
VAHVALSERDLLGHDAVELPLLRPHRALVAGVQLAVGAVAAVVIGAVGAEEVDPQEVGALRIPLGMARPLEGALHGLAVFAAGTGEVVPPLMVGAAHVAEEGPRPVAGAVELDRQGGQAVGEAVAVLGDAVAARIETGEERGEGGPGGRPRRHRVVERHARRELGVDPRAGRPHLVAVSPEAVGTQGVDGEQHDVPAAGAAGQAAALPGLRPLSAVPQAGREAAQAEEEHEEGQGEPGGRESAAHGDRIVAWNFRPPATVKENRGRNPKAERIKSCWMKEFCALAGRRRPV